MFCLGAEINRNGFHKTSSTSGTCSIKQQHGGSNEHSSRRINCSILGILISIKVKYAMYCQFI